MGNPSSKRDGGGRLERLQAFGAAALWIGAWQLASMAVGSRILLAGPVETACRLVALAATGEFWLTLAASFGRIALGFFLGLACALALGLLAGRHRAAERLLAPALSALKSVPLVCIIVLLLMWVGSRRVSAIAVFLATFPALYFSVIEGLHAQDGRLEEVVRAFEVPRARRFLIDGWQQLLPYLVASCRNACGMAWKSGVAAEVIGSPPGTVGERVYQAKLLLETGDLFAWTIAIVAASWACERLFLWLLKATGPAALRLAEREAERGACRGGAAAAAASDAATAPAPIALRGATLGYPGGAVVARGMDLLIGAGKRCLLDGPSGAGKTTLIRTVARLQEPLAGFVEAPAHLSLMCQEARLVEGMDAVGNVAVVAGCAFSEAHALLAELLPEDALGCPVAELSGGQRRRVELARALAHPGAAVILDEPFASLDAATHEAASAFVLRHLAGRTLLAASHEAGDAELLDVDERL